jgi:hypothetical protein
MTPDTQFDMISGHMKKLLLAVTFLTLFVGSAFAGQNEKFSGATVFQNGTITIKPGASTAAAGTTSANAAVLPAATSTVYPTTAADTKGVRVHVKDQVAGRTLFIGNGVSAQILKVYAPTGGSINGAAADAAFSSASGKGVILVCLSATANTWLAW